jgi:hypothetical protein
VTAHFVLPPTPLPVPTPAPPAKKKKVIVLKPLAPVLKWIHLDDNISWRLGQSRRGPSSAGILLPIYFDAIRSDAGTGMEYVKAHLVLTERNLQRQFTVAHACWIGNVTLDYIALSPGEDRQLLLAVMKDKGEGGLLLSTNRTSYDWYNESNPEEEFATEDIPLGTYEVTVVVTWQGNGKEVFELPVDLQAFSITYPS